MTPEPLHIERHPAGYDWRTRFPGAKRVVASEGGSVYRATTEGSWWLISDESTALELLDDAELRAAAITIRHFGDRAACEAKLQELLAPVRPALLDHLPPLRHEDLPPPYADWSPDISEFAISFPGYEYFGGSAALSWFAHAARTRFSQTGALPDDLHDLRAALFFEQRSHHFSDSASDPERLRYIHALVEAIGEQVNR